MRDFYGRALLVAEADGARSALRDLLRWAGYQPLEAGGVEEALDLLSALGPCELGVADVNMGMSTCLDLLKRAGREAGGVMRFIIVLAELRTELVMDALMGGFDDYLLRPVSPAGLAKKLKTLGLPARAER